MHKRVASSVLAPCAASTKRRIAAAAFAPRCTRFYHNSNSCLLDAAAPQAQQATEQQQQQATEGQASNAQSSSKLNQPTVKWEPIKKNGPLYFLNDYTNKKIKRDPAQMPCNMVIQVLYELDLRMTVKHLHKLLNYKYPDVFKSSSYLMKVLRDLKLRGVVDARPNLVRKSEGYLHFLSYKARKKLDRKYGRNTSDTMFPPVIYERIFEKQ